MKIHFVSYAHGDDYINSANKVYSTIIKYQKELDSVSMWKFDDVKETSFYKQNPDYQELLTEKIGARYWSWKPLM